jgi:hypothetical protein
MLAIDHGRGGAALLGEGHDGVRPETGHHVMDELLFGHVPDEDVETFA